MRGTREPSHQNWHSADLLQLHGHESKHACVCVCVGVFMLLGWQVVGESVSDVKTPSD